jgi:hypothetical protein
MREWTVNECYSCQLLSTSRALSLVQEARKEPSGAWYAQSMAPMTHADFFRKAEAFGILVGAGQGVEATLGIIKKFKKAYDRAEEQVVFLDRHRVELLAIKEQISKIEKDKALGTSAVLTAVGRLKDPEERLARWVKKVDKRGQKAKFLNQLVNGNAERKELEEILGDMTRVKADLTQAITRAINERARRIEKGVAANGVGIREIKGMLVDGPISASGNQSVPKQRQPRRTR